MKYIVDKNKKTVVAIIEDCEYDLINYILNRFDTCSSSRINLSKNLLLRNKYIGKAKCSDADEFDIEYGKLLAARRASVKYENDRKKKFDWFLESLYTVIDGIRLDQNHRTEHALERLEELF